jgi:hypothetical protein
MEKLSFLQRPIKLLEQGLQASQHLMAEDSQKQVMEVKQATDVSGSMLGIGSTVLAGGRAFVGQGMTVMLLLFFFLASSESLLRRIVEILPHFDDKRRVVSIVSGRGKSGINGGLVGEGHRSSIAELEERLRSRAAVYRGRRRYCCCGSYWTRCQIGCCARPGTVARAAIARKKILLLCSRLCEQPFCIRFIVKSALQEIIRAFLMTYNRTLFPLGMNIA